MFDLEFTGERVVPDKVDPELQLEHSTRYHLAARWVANKRVLDYGCGTGYGAAILQQAGARQVVGCDLSTEAVLYAKNRFEKPGLAFCVTDCEGAGFCDGSFDMVVSFELIEHLQSYPKYLEEVRRLLPEDGLFLVSTPNKTTYNDERHSAPNPFHVHEFYLEELRSELSSFFPAVNVVGQSRTEGVLFHGEIDPTDPATVALTRDDEARPIRQRHLTSADYFVAICGHSAAAVAFASDSFHIAESNALRDRNLRILELQKELEERTQWARSLEDESSRRGRRVLELQEELEERTQWAKQLEGESTHHGHRVLELQAELQERLRWANELDNENEAKDLRIRELRNELELIGHAMERLAKLENQLDQRLTESQSQLKAEVQQQLDTIRQQLDLRHGTANQLQESISSHLDQRVRSLTVLAEQRQQALVEQLRQRQDGHAKALERSLGEQLERFADPGRVLEQELGQSRRQTAEFDNRLVALQGLHSWQRDSLIHHQEKIELQHGLLAEEQVRIEQLQRDLDGKHQRIEHQEQQLQQQQLGLHEQLQRIDRVDHSHAADRDQLRAAIHQQDSSLAQHRQLLDHQASLLEIQDQLLSDVEQSAIHNRHLTEVLWSSLPWRLYCKLGSLLQRLRSQLPSGRRERQTRAAEEAAHVEHRVAALAARWPGTAEPRISIVVPFAEPGELLDCIEQVTAVGSAGSANSDVPFDVIGIHQSTARPAHQALTATDRLAVFRCRRRDRSAMLRLAAEKARGQHLLLLRSDARVEPGWLEHLCRTIEQHPEAGLVGPRLLSGDGGLLAAGGLLCDDASTLAYGQGQSPELRAFSFAREVDFCDDACWLIHRSLFDALKSVDGRLVDSALRAADFSLRCRQLGARTYYQPAAKIRVANGLPNTDPDVLDEDRRRMQERWPAELAAMPAREHASHAPRAAAESRHQRRALVLDHRLPTPDQDAGSVRMDALLDVLRQLGFQVTFLPENLYAMEPYCEPLQARGIEVVTTPEESSLRGYLASQGERYELAIVSRFHIASGTLDMVRELCPQALIVFDTVDLQFLRLARQAELQGDPALAAAAEQTREAELELASRADAVLVVSEVERELLENQASELDVHLVSLIHDLGEPVSNFDDRRDFFFIGGYEHPPNQDAALWFCREILPRIHRELPEARLHLLGSKLTDEIRGLASSQVEVVGFVEDLTPYLRGCRLSLAPLRYGAGIKGKVTESLASGLPMVVTSIAAEGIGLEHGQSAMIADDPDLFAQAVIEVYRDPQLWQRLSSGGQQAIADRFSPQAARQAMVDLLARHQR